MATKTLAVANQARNTQVTTWASLANGDDGQPLQAFDYSTMCVQLSGTFGVGGSVQIEGSNDGTNWFVLTGTLTAAAATAIIKTAAYMGQVIEQPLFIRPRVTAGDGSTLLNALIYGTRGRS
jgi:hypothetical protein